MMLVAPRRDLLLGVAAGALGDFFIALGSMQIFAVQFKAWDLPYLPTGADIWDPKDPLALARHLVLPVFCLVAIQTAGYSRYLRTSILEVLGMDYVRTAHAKGLSNRTVLFKHALRNAILPFVTVVGLDIPFLLGGALVTESIFAWPGMGRLFWEYAQRGDYPVVLGVLLLTSSAVVFFTIIVDMAYTIIDPRIRLRLGAAMTINPTISEPSISPVDFVKEETREALTPGQLVWRRFRKHRMALIGAVGITLLVLFIIIGSIIVPETSANTGDLLVRLLGPGAGHPFGTDSTGRDVFDRIIYGGQISLFIGILAVALEVSLGTVIGGVAAYFGGWVDAILMRFTEAMLAIPSLFLLIVLAKFLGQRYTDLQHSWVAPSAAVC